MTNTEPTIFFASIIYIFSHDIFVIVGPLFGKNESGQLYHDLDCFGVLCYIFLFFILYLLFLLMIVLVEYVVLSSSKIFSSSSWFDFVSLFIYLVVYLKRFWFLRKYMFENWTFLFWLFRTIEEFCFFLLVIEYDEYPELLFLNGIMTC